MMCVRTGVYLAPVFLYNRILQFFTKKQLTINKDLVKYLHNTNLHKL